MNFDRLKEFILIADTGSIREAAKELDLPAATLQARCRTFEKTLGFPLFERRSRGSLPSQESCKAASDYLPDRSRSDVTLTKSGAMLYKNAVQIIKEYETLKEELSSISSLAFASLTIAVADYGLPFYLGPFLDLLNTHYPQMQLDILDGSQYTIAEGLTSGHIDLYFASVPDFYRPEGIARHLISRPQPCVLLPSCHRLASRSSVSVRELARERFILYPETKETCIRDFQLANLKAAKIPYSLYEHHTSPSFYELLVPVQKGIILSPTPILHMPPNTAAVPLTDLKYRADSCLFYHKHSRKPEVTYFVNAFVRFISEE